MGSDFNYITGSVDAACYESDTPGQLDLGCSRFNITAWVLHPVIGVKLWPQVYDFRSIFFVHLYLISHDEEVLLIGKVQHLLDALLTLHLT